MEGRNIRWDSKNSEVGRRGNQWKNKLRKSENKHKKNGRQKRLARDGLEGLSTKFSNNFWELMVEFNDLNWTQWYQCIQLGDFSTAALSR